MAAAISGFGNALKQGQHRSAGGIQAGHEVRDVDYIKGYATCDDED